ncbi:MAG: sensor histidine kinase [Oscillospiraceae bacterium]
MKPNEKIKLQKLMMKKYQRRFFVFFAAYMLILFGITVLGLLLKDSQIWYRDDFWFPFLAVIYYNWPYAVLFLAVIGAVLIVRFQWKNITENMLALVDAIDKMAANPDELVDLPESLDAVKGVMQDIQHRNIQDRMRAQEAEQKKNDMVVYLAHDLKTPLTSVLGYLSLLRDESQISEDTRQKYISIASEKAQRLEDLINEFFEITRYSLKGLSLQPTVVDFTRLLEQVNDEFKPLLTPKNLQAVLQAPKDIKLYADAGKLERVVDNLLRNAVSYSHTNSSIQIRVEETNGWACLQIKNSGDTIPPHKLAHIFEQFYRVDEARSGSENGAGLGLAIAKEIVEMHGGSIMAQSEDETIVFTVWLPLFKEPAMPQNTTS